MRVLLTSYDFRPSLGGVATCAFELARALSVIDGVKVRVLAPRAVGDREFDGHGLFETVRRDLPGTASRAVLPMTFWFAGQTRAWRPDAVINLLWQPCGLATMMSAPLAAGVAAPYFVLAHGVEIMESRRSFKKRMRARLAPAKKMVFRRAAAAFPVSRFTGELLHVECGIPREKIRVIHNGVDTQTFHPDGPSPDLVAKHQLAGRRVFLSVTRLDDYKGVDRTIGALRYVVARHPEIVYLICGTGYDQPRLEALTRHFGLEGHVIFAGRVPPGRLTDYYNLAECFILASRTDLRAPNCEGFGIVFLEAAACGKPAIAGDSGGIPDAVGSGETGWLVPPENEHEIARAMLECLENPALARAKGLAARQRVLAAFTWEHVARKVHAEIAEHVRH